VLISSAVCGAGVVAMRTPFTVCLLAATQLMAGCALVRDATDLVAYKARQCCNECAERRRDERWAEEAWEQQQGCGPHTAWSLDYARGFKEGYADFLFRGGSGEPPLVAPKTYRTVGYQTPEGYRAIQEWFDGYRYGAATARQSGYRQFVTGPCSLLPGGPPPQTPAGPDDRVLPSPEQERLPPPRKEKDAPPPTPTDLPARMLPPQPGLHDDPVPTWLAPATTVPVLPPPRPPQAPNSVVPPNQVSLAAQDAPRQIVFSSLIPGFEYEFRLLLPPWHLVQP
jgi:hypothetical protein